MRTAFIEELIAQARLDPSIFLVVGDLGYSVVEPFAQEFPDRFLNAGVAEQNMTGVAAGLASEGYHVFTYSIANFPTLRCLEQIRNDICYHNLPVTVVSVGAGLAYGNLGYSHHGVQDIAALRGMPNLSICSPADPGEARECLQWLVANPHPSYLRLGKAGEMNLHEKRGIEKSPLLIREGNPHHSVVATGSVLLCALEAAEQLSVKGIDLSVYSWPLINQVDLTQDHPIVCSDTIFTVEEHVRPGGFGEFVAGQLAYKARCHAFSVPVSVSGLTGSQNALRKASGLDRDSIAERIIQILV